ncbi:MAG: single-stranded-DNA-specific exonuclease RecJ [Spirochaetales bacterium]|nr:single-stranded-DNA-specific exonuclease RecJ [Spirochaetales bacterium]
MIWEKTEIDSQLVRNIVEKYSIDSLLASILVRRGVTAPEDIKFYLENDLRYLHNPFLFNEMEDLIDRLHQARDEEEKVLVFGDKDVDGVTSSVILYQNLQILNLDLKWKVPTGNDSYGLSVSAVEEAYNQDISLIITVDCGVSAFDSISRANELGIDVIVIDHHNPRNGELPQALCIVNPKLENSGYPFSGLAAVGVVSKVIWAISFSLIETLYKSSLCFLHGEEDEDGATFYVVKLYNLVRVYEESFKISVNDPLSGKRLLDAIKGEQILVYGEMEQKKIFNSVFGTGTILNALDIKPEIVRVLSGINGHSLKILLKHSKIRLYSCYEFTEIDVIVNLFITYTERRYEEHFIPFVKSLDLVALGTIADLMPLSGENRILVRKGLEILSRTERDGLQALMLMQNIMGKDISSKDVSWVLAPIINSAGRMQKADVAVSLLLSENPDMRNKNALDILELNKDRRGISDSIWSNLYNDFFKCKEEFHNKIIVFYHPQITKGVTGLIASKALAAFNVPSIIIAKDGDSLSGSIRSHGNLEIDNLFTSLAPILTEWGGHNCAAGFKLKFLDLNNLLSRIKKLVLSRDIVTNEIQRSDKLIIDAFIPENYLTPEIMKIHDYFEPYGEGNRPLQFVTKSVKILDINFMGKLEKKHLKILLEIGKYKWPAIYWNSADKAGVDFTKGDVVDIAYRVERNFYGGSETLQLNILDIIK